MKDFAPVAPVARQGYVLVAHPSFPANTVAEMVALAKASPGKVFDCLGGNGTLNHLIGEMLQRLPASSCNTSPGARRSRHRRGGRAGAAVGAKPAVGHCVHQAGKLKVLGVVNEKRVAALPDTPTIGETIRALARRPGTRCLRPQARPLPSWRSCKPKWPALEHKDVVEKTGHRGL